MASWRNHCCYGNATVRSLCIVEAREQCNEYSKQCHGSTTRRSQYCSPNAAGNSTKTHASSIKDQYLLSNLYQIWDLSTDHRKVAGVEFHENASSGSSCECGDEHSGSIKCGKFLDWLKLVSFSRRTVLHGASK